MVQLTCLCCKQEMKFAGEQPALVKGKPDKIYVHCINPDCQMHMKTSFINEIEKQWEKYGKPMQ